MFTEPRDADPNAASEHPATPVERIARLEDDLAELKASMKEMIDLFKGAKTVLALLKWLGGIAITVSTLWYMFSNSPNPFKPH